MNGNAIKIRLVLCTFCAGVLMGSTAFAKELTVKSDVSAPYIEITKENKPKNLLNVKYIGQKDNIAAGCESISATMLLNFLGYKIDEHKFVKEYLLWENFEKIGTNKQGLPIYKGPNPRTEAFAGDPYGNCAFPNCGFGCFAKVIEKSINNYFKSISNQKHTAKSIIGKELKDIAQEYIEDKKLPILVWATINMKKSYIGPRVWKTKDGGEYAWRRGEHCLLLTGFNDTHYFFADPYENHGIVGYEKKLVEERYAEMGKEILTILPKESKTECKK